MTKRGLQYEITTGRFTLPVTFLLVLLIGGAVDWLMPELKVEDTYLFRNMLWQWIPGEWLDRVVMFLAHLFVGYLLIEVNNAYGIIRMRTSMQTSLYGWLLVSTPYLFLPSVGPLLACFLILSIYFLFRGYQQNEPVNCVFHAWLFWGLGTLLFPPLFWFLPLLLVGAYMFKALSWRTFFAGLVGLSIPYWFLLVYAYCKGQMDVFKQPFAELVNFQPIGGCMPPVWALVSVGALCLLLLVSSVHYMMTSYDDKIRTRNYLLFLIWGSFLFVVLGILQPQHTLLLLSLLLPIVAFLGAHLFTLSHSRTSSIFFVVYLCLLIATFSYNIWMLSYNF